MKEILADLIPIATLVVAGLIIVRVWMDARESRKLQKKVDEELLAECKRIITEHEQLRMQLAACGVAAMCNTRESAEKERIGRENPYWSASYADVCRAVDREMAWREYAYDLADALAALRDAAMVQPNRTATLDYRLQAAHDALARKFVIEANTAATPEQT